MMVLPFYCLGPQDQTQALKIGRRHLYLLTHLPGLEKNKLNDSSVTFSVGRGCFRSERQLHVALAIQWGQGHENVPLPDQQTGQ